MPTQSLVAAEVERRAVQGVRAALGDGVDAAAGEAALTHVVRRDDQLDFLDRVEADRLRFRRAAGRAGRARQAEQVVVGRAVDLEGVVAEAVARHRNDRRAVAGAAPCELNSGLMRTMSAMLRVMVGSVSLTAFEMLSAVPATRGVDQRRCGHDFDRFADRRDLQLEIHQLPLRPSATSRPSCFCSLKPASSRVDVVDADADVQDV